LEALVPPEVWNARTLEAAQTSGHQYGSGRDLFGLFRANATDAESGARSCQP
jgi:phosphogluconate dehydratase